MTNFNSMKMVLNSQKGLKALLENEKSLVTSNSSFSHSVFKRLVQQEKNKEGLKDNDMNQINSVPF